MSDLPVLLVAGGCLMYVICLSTTRAMAERALSAFRVRTRREQAPVDDEETSTEQQGTTRVRREDDPEITRFDTSVLDRFKITPTTET